MKDELVGIDSVGAAPMKDELVGIDSVGAAPMKDELVGIDSVVSASVALCAGSKVVPEPASSLEGSRVTDGIAVVVTDPSGLEEGCDREVGAGGKLLSVQKLLPSVGQEYPIWQHISFPQSVP
ncbi:hypothetical protein N7494_003760 [Penicillium frequentans]|uniref:Uncharacterized protein n=1 Tax=Penicillium frequentans TaxID=3151616 RepID=A0AAD6CZC7_9EURO|nr:hypothetical protein N7494_003760 [Penicillium glabrum]